MEDQELSTYLKIKNQSQSKIFGDFFNIRRLLAAFSTPDIHRCIVLTQHLEYKIISQTDVIAWMISHKDQIGKSVLGKSLEQLGLKVRLHSSF